MYTPKFNEIDDISIIKEHIHAHPFGSWSCIAEGEIVVNHIPFVYHDNRGEYGTLAGHVSRANPIWKTCSREKESIVAFQGENAYISPSWYPSKHQHGKAVPTWNYTVVQVYGAPLIQDSRDWLLDHVTELTDRHEADKALPWRVGDAPDEYIEKLVGAIVGIEISITSITGKWKLGQNKPETDQIGMAAGLKSRNDGNSRALGELTERLLKDK